MDAIILNIFEVNYSQLIQNEILEKLVTLIVATATFLWVMHSNPSLLIYLVNVVHRGLNHFLDR